MSSSNVNEKMKPSCLWLVVSAVVVVLVSPVFGAQRVRLQDVQVLTLQSGKQTTARRTHALPQIKCVGGSASKSNLHPNVVQCYNRGFDGSDVQWECKAELDNAVKFGSITVACEGYDYPDDPYILAGSCGLEYNLEYTGKTGGNRNIDHGNKDEMSMKHILVFIGVVGIVYIIYSKCLSVSPDDHPDGSGNRPGGGGGGGGGGSGGPPPPPPYSRFPPDNSQPPPYGFRDEYQSKQSSQGASYEQSRHQQQENRQANAGSGPGFWTGLGAGGLLGYLAGNSGQRSGYNTGSYGQRWSPSDTFGSSTHSQSSSSAGETSRTTSGFGGTRRR